MKYLIGDLAESLGLRKFIQAAALSLVFAACKDLDLTEKPRKPVATYNTKSEDLSTGQLSGNLQNQVAPWTEWGDIPGNFAEIDGKHYVLFSNIYTVDSVTGKKEVYYVECDQLDQCFDATATRQTLEGLKEAKLPGPFGGVGIYPKKDEPGKYRIMVDPNGEWIHEGDVSKNPVTGKLLAENFTLKEPTMDGSLSMYTDSNGVPHTILGGDKKAFDLNLYNIDDITQLPDAPKSGTYDTCGLPAFDGDLLAFGSALKTISGIKHCDITFASSLMELLTNPKQLTSLNSQATGPVRRFGDPRIASNPDGSGIEMHSSTNGSPGDLGGNPLTRIEFIKIPAPTPPTPSSHHQTPAAAMEVMLT